MTRRCRGVAGLVVALALVGCGGGVSSHLIASPDEGALCTPAQQGDTTLIAHNPLANEGSEEAVLRDVRLVDATNLGVKSYDVLVHGEEGFRGVGEPISLSEATPTIKVDESAMVRVIVKLVDPSIPGEAAAFDVEYSDADGRGSASVRTTVTMEVRPQGQTCVEF